MLFTTNPAGKGYLWKMACDDSKSHRVHPETGRKMFMWVEAASDENPTLPQDYLDRLVARYGFNTPAYKRWVKGMSSALEGSVFTEFDPHPENCMHVVPSGIEIPQEWEWGRGMDYGMVNPTAVVWAAKDPEGNWWVDKCHYAPEAPEQRDQWSVELHAEAIKRIDATYDNLTLTPADPSMFAKIHTDGMSGVLFSTADEFYEHGVSIYPADNNRESGLSLMLDLMMVDKERCHPVTLTPGSPKLFILDRECNQPLIQELGSLLWAKPDGTTEKGRPDDCMKKNDHAYDALRYLVKDSPAAFIAREPVTYRDQPQALGSRGQERRY